MMEEYEKLFVTKDGQFTMSHLQLLAELSHATNVRDFFLDLFKEDGSEENYKKKIEQIRGQFQNEELNAKLMIKLEEVRKLLLPFMNPSITLSELISRITSQAFTFGVLRCYFI